MESLKELERQRAILDEKIGKLKNKRDECWYVDQPVIAGTDLKRRLIGENAYGCYGASTYSDELTTVLSNMIEPDYNAPTLATLIPIEQLSDPLPPPCSIVVFFNRNTMSYVHNAVSATHFVILSPPKLVEQR